MNEVKSDTDRSMQLDKRPLETIWRVSDELWNKLKPVLDEYDPPKLTGRKRINSRAAQKSDYEIVLGLDNLIDCGLELLD